MFRARLAALAVSGGLVLVGGCMSFGNGGGLGLFSHGRGTDCDCMMMGQHYGVPTTVTGGETTIVQPQPAFPAINPPMSPHLNPMQAPPPRIIPIPQAPAVPYSP